MTIFDRLLHRWGYVKAMPPLPDHLTAEALLEHNDPADPSSYTNQADLYRRLSWVMAAVGYPAMLAAGVTLNVKERKGEEVEDIPNHEFELMLDHPNPLQTKFQLFESTYSFYKLNGNAFWWLNRTGEKEKPLEVWSLPPDRFTLLTNEDNSNLERGKNMLIRGYRYDCGSGEFFDLPAWNVCHFRAFNPKSIFTGMSLIEPIADTATLDMDTLEFVGNLYGESNGRMPGILAFADPINDTDWERQKADITAAAKLRQYLLLRGVGTGQVGYIQAANTLKDMELIAGRKLNKEEIFTVLAPGLASMLDVNATEANARTGKATLMELVIWPLLQMVAQQITLQLLPLYGEKLIAEFDEVRLSDRAMELQEMAEYSKTHTIDEIRHEYYQDDPLAKVTKVSTDDRGILLPAQVSPALPAPRKEEPEEEKPTALPENVTISMPEQMPEAMGEETGEGVQEPLEEAVEAEMKRWQRKALNALKRGKSADVPFNSELVMPSVTQVVSDALKLATTAEEVKAAFEVKPVVTMTPAPNYEERIYALLERAIEKIEQEV